MRKKSKKNDQQIFLSALALVLTLVFCLYISTRGDDYSNSTLALNKLKTTKVVYPMQYSDTHVIQSAVASDERYKNIGFSNSGEQIASVVNSTVIASAGVNTNNDMENGTWLWTPIPDMNHKYILNIISNAMKNNINAIYVSIDSYLDAFAMNDGNAKDLAKKNFIETLEFFISEAHKAGIVVDAEAGWQNWAEPGNFYKSIAILDFIKDFNSTQKEKFRGLQYDIEVYLLSGFEKNKTPYLSNFVSLVDNTVTKLSGTDLTLSIAVPDFYDSMSNETPSFVYRGKDGYVFDHLLSVLDKRENSRILVMSYRNFSSGENSSTLISKGEIVSAENHPTKVIIAQETGDVEPDYLTFHGKSREYYNSQVAVIRSTFSANKSFAGIATHYVNSFMELK